MSGIFGIVNFGGLVDSTTLHFMANTLAHRGPDGYRLWINGDVGFGHRMLFATPEAPSEVLPFYDIESQLAITSDARLDNRDELISAIGKINFKTEIISDSLIILESYKKWGQESVHHLIGDFSFAIWDLKIQRLFCARDHLGIKPFNYYHISSSFFFCSEAHVIAKNPQLAIKIFHPRLADFFTPHLEGIDKTCTLYAGVFRLPPGNILIFNGRSVRINQYWKPLPVETTTRLSTRDSIEELKQLLSISIKNRLRGINGGILLSGGLDSTLITAIANELVNKGDISPFKTFSCVSENENVCIESRMIKQFSNSIPSEAHLFSPKEFINNIENVYNIIKNIQEPFDIVMVFVFFLYHKAKENNCSIVLDGVDGDVIASLPSNYPVYLVKNIGLRSAILEIIYQASNQKSLSKTTIYKLAKTLLMAVSPLPIKKFFFKKKAVTNVTEFLSNSIITENFFKFSNLEERLNYFENENRVVSFENVPSAYYLNKVLHPNLTVALERYDRTASICSIEPRHPYITKQIVEFFCQAFWDKFVRFGRSKFLLRKLAEKYLRAEQCWRFGKEHVGHLFFRELITQKQKSLESILEVQAKNLSMLANINGCLKSFNSYDIKNQVIVAGLLLWLDQQDV